MFYIIFWRRMALDPNFTLPKVGADLWLELNFSKLNIKRQRFPWNSEPIVYICDNYTVNWSSSKTTIRKLRIPRVSNKPIEDLWFDTMASSFHGLSELLLATFLVTRRQTETAVYNSDFIRRLIMRASGRRSFKRSFSMAEHKIGDQLAFLFARDEPVITVLRHHRGGIISVL